MDQNVFKAIDEGDVASIRRLLSNEDVNKLGKDGYTPLYYACMKKGVSKSFVEVILSLGADVNKKGRDSESPLYIACFNGKLDVALLLLDEGADVKAVNGPIGETALHAVARTDRCVFIDLLVARGANINAVNVKKETPLYLAAKDGFQNAVYHLLKAGANANLSDADGKEPLYIASEKGFKHVVIVLKSNPKDIDVAKARADEMLRQRPSLVKSTEEILEDAESGIAPAPHRERPLPPKETKTMEIVQIVVPRPKGRNPLGTPSKGPCLSLEEVGYDEPPAIPTSLQNRPPVVNKRIGGTSMRVGTSIDSAGVEPPRVDNMLGDSMEFVLPSRKK